MVVDIKSVVEDEPHYSFGRATAGSKLSHEFTIYNRSSSPVRIQRISTSCGCTTAKPTANPISAGGHVGLTVYVDTTGKSGRVLETIYAVLGDGSTKKFTTEVFVEGPRVAVLDFGELLRGETGKTKSFVLSWPEDRPLHINTISHDAEWLEISHSSEQEQRTERIYVSPARGIPWGPFAKEIVISTNDSIMARKTVLVKGTVLYPIALSPQQVLLGEFRPGERKSASVRVYSPYNFPLSIERTDVVEGNAVDWTYINVAESEQRLDLVVDEAQYPGERIMKSVLRINARVDGKPQQITVDVYGLRSTASSEDPA